MCSPRRNCSNYIECAFRFFFDKIDAQLKEGLIFRLQLASTFSGISEHIYSSVKLTSILTKMHVTQVNRDFIEIQKFLEKCAASHTVSLQTQTG